MGGHGSGSMGGFPVVRLRGLPFDCREADVYEFFGGLDIVDVLLVHKKGRFSGEAFVVVAVPLQVDFALQRNRQNMGRRYVEVFRSKKQDYYAAIAAEVHESRSRYEEELPAKALPKAPKAEKEAAPPMAATSTAAEHTGVIRLRGLPFSVTKKEIIDFFACSGLDEDNIHIVTHADGRATGEAFVEFGSPNESRDAMKKDKMTLGTRYVELFPSSREEATRAAAKSQQ
jgi:heterogeneous nuclear ribonucleoprotein F/H